MKSTKRRETEERRRRQQHTNILQRQNTYVKLDVTKLKVIQHNVQNWQTKRHALTNVYLQENPHILLLNSHGLIDDQTLKIQNYNIHINNKDNEQHNGTAVAIRRDIKYKLLEDFYSDMLGVTIETKEGPIHLITTYIPPRHQHIHYPDFYQALTKPEPVYILGDLNARHPYFGHGNKNTRGELLMFLLHRGHAQHLGPPFPTFITHRSATAPDIILANYKIFHNTHTEEGKILTPSDHNYIVFTISSSPIQIPIKTRPSLPKADWHKYKEILSQHEQMNPNMTTEDIDNNVELWTNRIKEASIEAIPLTSFRTLPHYRTTHEAQILQIQYTALKHDIDMHGTNYDKFTRLNTLRYQLQDKYRTLYAQNWEEQIEKIDVENNPKTFWTSVKKLLGTGNKVKATYIKDHNNTPIYDNDKKEQIFRHYWENIFRISDEENQNFDPHTDRTVTTYISQHRQDTLPHDRTDYTRLTDDYTRITKNELDNTIKSIRQKAPGQSGITKTHLTQLPHNMTNDLLTITNAITSTGHFPKLWKQATIIFLPKPNKSPLSHTNYRPISLLEVPGKIVEKIINTRLTTLLEHKHLTNDNQHGFRPKRGTQTALAILYENIATIKGNDERLDLVLRDISRAFDKVWHDGLKYKLLATDLPDCLIRILCSYITDRTARIRIDDYIGPTFALRSGVPQGGCLSPTLFSFYTHDIPEDTITHAKYISYADDITQIVPYTGKSRNMHAYRTSRAITAINTYEKKWKIQTNKDKFQVINIGKHATRDIPHHNISHTITGKVLGLNIKSTGFTHHNKVRKNIAQSQLTKLYRFQNLSSNNKRKLYMTLVRSSLIYPIIPMHTSSKTQMLALQRIQNKATRFINNTRLSDRISSEQLHNMAELEPLNVVTHKQAQNIWNTVEHTLQVNTNEYTLQPGKRYNPSFPSSYHRAQRDIPPPLFS